MLLCWSLKCRDLKHHVKVKEWALIWPSWGQPQLTGVAGWTFPFLCVSLWAMVMRQLHNSGFDARL